MNLNSNGSTNKRVFVAVSNDNQLALNGLNLAEAVAKGLIKNDDSLKFQVMKSRYSDGQEYERLILNTNVGHIPLSMPLSNGGISKFTDNLGDLVIKKGVSWEDDATKASHPYFHLQAAGGSVEQVLEDVDITEFASA